MKDLPLALLIKKNLEYGSLIRKKGVNAYVFYINDLALPYGQRGILNLVNLLNGNMKTPKINSLRCLFSLCAKKYGSATLVPEGSSQIKLLQLKILRYIPTFYVSKRAYTLNIYLIFLRIYINYIVNIHEM